MKEEMNALKIYGESLGVLEKVSIEIIHEAIDEILEKSGEPMDLFDEANDVNVVAEY